MAIEKLRARKGHGAFCGFPGEARMRRGGRIRAGNLFEALLRSIAPRVARRGFRRRCRRESRYALAYRQGAISNRPQAHLRRGVFGALLRAVAARCAAEILAATPPDLIGLWEVVILCADGYFGACSKPWLGTVYVLFASTKRTKSSQRDAPLLTPKGRFKTLWVVVLV